MRVHVVRSVVLAAALMAACPAVGLCALHNGDKVSILVYNHPELTTEATVDSTGHVSMPLVGSVEAAGVSDSELAARIRGKLSHYMAYPAVNVTLLSQSQTIGVQGGPSSADLSYVPGETLASALSDIAKACACDLKASAADLTRVQIQRDGKLLGPYDMTGSNVVTPALQASDQIVLPNKSVAVIVKGQVKSPGTMYLGATEPLGDAITQAGGLTDDASRQILLQRGGALTQIAEGSPEYSMQAQPGDALTIPSEEHVLVVGAVNGTGATSGSGGGGEVTLRQDFTLLAAIYGAGGPNHWANLNQVVVMRRGTVRQYNISQLVHGNLAENPALDDGDIVFVPEGHKINWSLFWQSLIFWRWVFP